MRHLWLCAAALTLLAPAFDFASAAKAAAAPASAAAHTTHGGFLMTMGRDTVSIERFERTESRIVGTVLFKMANLRTDYVMDLRADGTVGAMLADGRQGVDSPETPARQSGTMLFRDDSVLTEMKPGKKESFATMPRALPYLNPSMIMFEQVVRRSRVIGGNRAIVPLFMVTGGQTLECLVTRVNADSVVLTLGGLDVRLAVDRDGNVTGGSVPAQKVSIERVSELSEDALRLALTDYSAPPNAPFTAGDVSVRTRGGFNLAGTLTRPTGLRGRIPIVVTITGSGRQDRDESLPILRGYRPFRQVAESLAARGIATLRMDDRGFGRSRGDASRATTADYANDIEDVVKWLRARKEVDPDRIALVGHSEGGVIAPMLAARDPKLCAIVLMAGTAYKGKRVLEYQRRQALEQAGVKGAQRDSIMKAANGSADTLARANPWLNWFMDYDPLTAVRGLKLPVLILQGETDRQVTEEQAKVLERTLRSNGNRDVTRRTFPNTNHLFVPDANGSPEGYGALSDPNVRPEVLSTLAQWLQVRMQKAPPKK